MPPGPVWCCSMPREVTTAKSTLGAPDQKNARILSPGFFILYTNPVASEAPEAGPEVAGLEEEALVGDSIRITPLPVLVLPLVLPPLVLVPPPLVPPPLVLMPVLPLRLCRCTISISVWLRCTATRSCPSRLSRASSTGPGAITMWNSGAGGLPAATAAAAVGAGDEEEEEERLLPPAPAPPLPPPPPPPPPPPGGGGSG